MGIDEAISQRDAVEQLEQATACGVLTVEAAQKIADAFDADIDISDAPTVRFTDIVEVFSGDAECGIAIADLVVTIVDGIGETPSLPEFEGVAATARARYSQNLPILYDHVGLAIEYEPDIDWDEFDGPDLTFEE